MPITYLIGAYLATILALAALRPVAIRVGLVDIPGGRKTHIGSTPLVGGVGIFVGLSTVSLLYGEVLAVFAPLLSLSSLIVFIGVIDDVKDLKVSIRMTGHILVALAMAIVAEVQLHSVGQLFYGSSIEMGVLTIPFTAFATVGVINAINMSDGIDGLSGCLVVVALSCIGILALFQGDLATVSFITLLCCCVFAYLTMNFRRPWNRKALIYLGDAGSTMLGFMLAWLMIDSSQGESALFPPAYALWFLAIPLFDTVNLLIKRPMRGKSPFKPGVDHLHHMLIRRGYSVMKVVLILVSCSVVFATAGLLGLYYQVSEATMFQLFLCLFLIYFLLCDRLDPVKSDQHLYS